MTAPKHHRHGFFEDAQALLVAPLIFAFAVMLFREAGLLVCARMTVFPGINEGHVEMVASVVAALELGRRLADGDEVVHPRRVGDDPEIEPPLVAGAAHLVFRRHADVRRVGEADGHLQQVVVAGGGYVVDHTSDTYIVAADGKLDGKIAHAAPPDQVAAEIRKRLTKP